MNAFSGPAMSWPNRNRRVWSWPINAAAIGVRRARERVVPVSTRLTYTRADHMSPLFIFGAILPVGLIEFVAPSECQPAIQGQFIISRNDDFDVYQPFPLGCLRIDNTASHGIKVGRK